MLKQAPACSSIIYHNGNEREVESMRQVICLICVAGLMLILAAAVVAEPQFVCVNAANPQQTGPNEWRFEYVLTNHGGQIPIYDVEVSGYQYGWLYVELPNDWAMQIISGPIARFSTESAPCYIEYEMVGFAIYAATPVFGTVQVSFSDQYGGVFATGTTLAPIPEPGSILALVSAMFGLSGGMIMRKRR